MYSIYVIGLDKAFPLLTIVVNNVFIKVFYIFTSLCRKPNLLIDLIHYLWKSLIPSLFLWTIINLLPMSLLDSGSFKYFIYESLPTLFSNWWYYLLLSEQLYQFLFVDLCLYEIKVLTDCKIRLQHKSTFWIETITTDKFL